MMLLAEAALRSFLLTGAVWLALKLFRLRNPRTEMAVWSGMLLASLAMPLLMRWAPVETLPVPFNYGWDVTPASGASVPVAPAEESSAFPLITPLFTAYLSIALMFAARLGIGLIRGWRLLRRASRIGAAWTGGQDIRLSNHLAMPAAIGRTILVPADFLGWDEARRRAVLAHEASHVERGDFYLLLLSALHKALFWFNPAAWWLDRRLAVLAEINSDAAALAVAGDRLSYARLLVELAGAVRPAAAGLAMASHATVHHRVERILAGSDSPTALTWARLAMIAGCLFLATLTVAGVTTAPSGPPGPEIPREPGRQARALVLRQNSQELSAYRLDDGAARKVEKTRAERIAANRPQPGAEAALRSHIDQVQRGEIDGRTLGDGMADGIRGLLPQIRPDMVALGPVTDVRFEGVDPGGMDVYIVTHAHGARRWQILLSQDGRIESLWFSSL